MRQKLLVFFLCCLIPLISNAWSTLGHQLIAQIAVDHLSNQAMKHYQVFNQALDKSYASKSLVAAAPWLDRLRGNEKTAYLLKYHYVNTPFSIDGSPLFAADKINALTAIAEATRILQSSYSTEKEKGLQLRILLHVVGDLHQPLHTVSRFSAKYPKGDRGATFFPLAQNKIANNLHSYWDKGGGLFSRRKSGSALVKMARQIENKYPCEKSIAVNPELWAKESYQIATEFAYQTAEGKNPNRFYQKELKKIAEKRMALAGCRLANLLNQLVSL